jgi:purine catabolism regulator
MGDYVYSIIDDMKKVKSNYGEDSLSIEEILNLPAFEGYKLLAGNSGLKNRCKHITILETPNGISWLEGGEFLLTTGYAFLHNEQYKKTMLIDAKRKGVSAIAIKENRYFGEINYELIQQANEFGIPLIQIPYKAVYTRIISSFYDMLFYKENEYILKLNDIYEKLLNLSFENKDIDGIIYSLSTLSNANVFLFDKQLNIISSNIINEDIYNKLSEFEPFNKDGIHILKDTSCYLVNYEINGLFISIYPVVRDENKIAYLYIVNDAELDKLMQTSIEYGISILSMKLEEDSAARFAQTKFNKTIVEIMLNNKELPDEFYQNIERDLGWDYEGYVVGLCIRIHLMKDQNFEESRHDIYNILDSLINSNYLSTDKKSDVFIFIKTNSEDYLENIINNLHNYLKDYEERFKISLGVSNPYSDIKNIEKLYNEAYLAVLFSNQDQNTIFFNTLDTIKLLYPLKDDKEIQNYYDKTIKKLERYDEKHGTNLMETLETYFKYNSKKTVVANKLFIHVETLRYRLNRIGEITGYSLDNSEGIFALQMGIKLKRLIKIN